MKEKPVDNLSTEDIVSELVTRWNTDVAKLAKLLQDIDTLSEMRDMLLENLDKMTRMLHDIKVSRLTAKVPTLVLPLNIRFAANPTLTIGDAMEMLLIEKGALTQRQIIDEFKAGGFPINLSIAHIVIANAIKRDARNRFRRLKDGRVTLADGK